MTSHGENERLLATARQDGASRASPPIAPRRFQPERADGVDSPATRRSERATRARAETDRARDRQSPRRDRPTASRDRRARPRSASPRAPSDRRSDPPDGCYIRPRRAIPATRARSSLALLGARRERARSAPGTTSPSSSRVPSQHSPARARPSPPASPLPAAHPPSDSFPKPPKPLRSSRRRA